MSRYSLSGTVWEVMEVVLASYNGAPKAEYLVDRMTTLDRRVALRWAKTWHRKTGKKFLVRRYV